MERRESLMAEATPNQGGGRACRRTRAWVIRVSCSLVPTIYTWLQYAFLDITCRKLNLVFPTVLHHL